jgi:hypothetical protein
MRDHQGATFRLVRVRDLGPRFSLMNAPFRGRPLFPRTNRALAVHRPALEYCINGALKSSPCIGVQLNFRFFGVKLFF